MTKPTPHDYPFGSLIPNRSWSDVSRTYRYGFNGKEKDFETSTDNYDFGARIYDGRLGRWLSLDPLMKKYLNLSTYHFCSNSPIVLKDVDGRDITFTTGFLSSLYNTYYLNVKNNTYIVNMVNKYMINLNAYYFIRSSSLANSYQNKNEDGRFQSNFNLFQLSYYGNDNTIFVSTLMHELLHTKYSTWYSEMVIDGKWTNDAKTKHPKMYEYMLKYKDYKEIEEDGKYTQRNWEHQYMADFGRSSIIDAMKEQDKSDNISDRSGVIDGITYTSNDWYEAMSWAGLEGTDSWNMLSDDKKNLYTKIIDNPTSKTSTKPSPSKEKSESTFDSDTTGTSKDSTTSR